MSSKLDMSALPVQSTPLRSTPRGSNSSWASTSRMTIVNTKWVSVQFFDPIEDQYRLDGTIQYHNLTPVSVTASIEATNTLKFLPNILTIDGSLAYNKIDRFIDLTKGNFDINVVHFMPSGHRHTKAYQCLLDHFNAKGRYGIVRPKDTLIRSICIFYMNSNEPLTPSLQTICNGIVVRTPRLMGIIVMHRRSPAALSNGLSSLPMSSPALQLQPPSLAALKPLREISSSVIKFGHIYLCSYDDVIFSIFRRICRSRRET